MSITVSLTEKEILSHPNDYELGEYIRKKYWESRKIQNTELDEKPWESIDKIPKIWTCTICGKDTSEIESDYLIGYDHLSCRLKGDSKMDEKDLCVICGKETPYLKSTHIDFRIGYVEGCGQGCYQPNICDKV